MFIENVSRRCSKSRCFGSLFFFYELIGDMCIVREECPAKIPKIMLLGDVKREDSVHSFYTWQTSSPYSIIINQIPLMQLTLHGQSNDIGNPLALGVCNTASVVSGVLAFHTLYLNYCICLSISVCIWL